MLALSGHPIYKRTLTLLNESNVGTRNTLSLCHLATLRTKEDWQCLGGPAFNQEGCSSERLIININAGTANKHCMLEFKSYYLVFVSVVSVIVVVQQSSSNL